MKNKIFIFFILIIDIYSYIVIPFQELENDDIYEFKSVEELLEELSYLKLYSEFYMGLYPKILPVFFKNDIDFFYLYKHDEDRLKSKNNYEPSKSKSFKYNINGIHDKEYFLNNNNKYGKLGIETFNFLMTEGDIKTIYRDDKGQIEANNYLSFENINIFYKLDLSIIKNYAGYLGFSYPNSNYEDMNFLKELKDKALITNTVWSVQFPDIDEDTCKKGNIVIGELPHIYEPKYYKEEQYLKMKIPEMYNNDTEYAWKVNVDSVNILKKYYENTNKKELGLSCDYIKSISIEFGSYMMYAPKKLFEQLKELYFDKLFDGGICDYKKIKTEDDKIIIVYCEKRLFEIQNRLDFPAINIDIQKLGGTFELTYKDVFIEQKNKIYLLIAFSSKESDNNIKLGQKFLYKYRFTFDYENREIGVYKINLSQQKVFHRMKRAFRGKELIIYLFLVIFGIGLFYCYRKGYILKKKTIDYNTANKNISHFNREDIDMGYELKNND